jgi:hypothetical protein
VTDCPGVGVASIIGSMLKSLIQWLYSERRWLIVLPALAVAIAIVFVVAHPRRELSAITDFVPIVPAAAPPDQHTESGPSGDAAIVNVAIQKPGLPSAIARRSSAAAAASAAQAAATLAASASSRDGAK